MNTDNLFLQPLDEVARTAVKIAQEALEGELGDVAAKAFEANLQAQLAGTGLTVDDLDRLGEPRTWFGRLLEKIEDWWWDLKDRRPTYEDDSSDDTLIGALQFSVPLLHTCPLQETPLEYDEVDVEVEKALTVLADAITEDTDWKPVSFQLPKDSDDLSEDDDDPAFYIVRIWQAGLEDGYLFLVEMIQEDPKIMGLSYGIQHLPNEVCAELVERLTP